MLTVLTVAVVITVSAIGSLAWLFYFGSERTALALQQVRNLDRLASQIVYLDEVLSGSAFLAATTGNTTWERRHRRHAVILDSVLIEARGLVAEIVRGPVGLPQTESANELLLDLEDQVFALVEQGELAEAQRVLTGRTYLDAKSDYAAGIADLDSVLQLETAALVSAAERRATVSIPVAVLVVIATVVGWVFILRRTTQWHDQRQQQQTLLSAQASDLRRLNAELDQRVDERTRDLQEAHGALMEKTESLSAALGALRRTEAATRQLIDNAPFAIFQSTDEGRLLSINPAAVRLLGCETTDQVMELNLMNDVYVNADDRRALFDACREAGKAEAEAAWRCGDAGIKTVRVLLRRLETEAGPVGFEMFAEDISRSRQLEVQLRQSQKLEAVGQLTGGIAHDFNNILSIVLANTDLAKGMVPADGGELEGMLAEVATAAQRGAAIVRQLLGFTRQAELVRVPTDLGDVVRKFTTMLQRLIPESISLTVEVEDKLPVTVVDTASVEQMLLNLVTNARDALPLGGDVTIKVMERELDEGYGKQYSWVAPGTYVAVTVRDTGAGMDVETKRRIFEPFFTTKPVGQGTGLGMAMVYGLVKQQDGFVHVYSELGLGTTVTIYFPAGEGKPDPQEVAAKTQELRGGTETILIVEDEPALASVAQRVLERYGYRVQVAQNGLQALEIFEASGEAIDLIFSDVVMPTMSGPELYARLKEKTPAPKIVFASGYTGHGRPSMEALDLGVPVLSKPWSIPELLRAIRNTLDA